ncbi:MAG: hypothetical protein LBC81_05135 [Tannerellaceae bacterium]|nr:hypothetical protein [Tannerellaceae bacterium]
MKTCFKHILFTLCLIAGFATLTTTCTFEDDNDNDNGGGQTHPLEEGIISFKLKLPNNSTRALTLADENELNDVKILVFKTTGEFLYSADAILDNLDNEPMVKRYKAKVSPTKSNEKVDIMTIANGGSIIRQLYPDGIPNNQGLTRNDLTNAFNIERPNGWIVKKSDSNYTPIPMWGWAPGVSIDSKTGLGEAHSTFHLTRMVAKIDVSIIGEAKNNFKMSGVYLMNRNTVGRLIPNVAAPNVWTGSSPKAVTPSLPDNPKPEKGADNYLAYAENYVEAETLEHEVKGVIYSFEAEKGVPYEASTAYEESPCIIIGGKFLNSQNVTYYRVDFEKTNAGGAKEHLHLLRNYLYSISISRITGPGYPDIDGALKNKPLNIIGEVEPWIDSDMPHQVTDGIHVLSVDRDEFLFYAPGDADSMRIYTDVSSGWRINAANVASWLQFVSPSPNDSGYVKGAPLSYIRVIIKPSEIKETDSPRETSFTVEAGALKKSITVRQTNESPHGLTASPSVLIFPLSAPDAKTVKVTSMPADAVRSVIYTTTGSIKFLPGKGPQDYHNTKATNFIIQPVAGGSGTVHMVIRTANAEGLSDTQVVTIIQLNTDSMFGMVGLPDAGYEAADQGNKIIQILSEIPWKLNLMPQNNPSNAPWTGNMLKLTDLDEHPARPEVLVDYHFELFQNPNYGRRTAYVGVMSTVPGWQYITFPIKQKGTPPHVKIISPESKQINFGESIEPQSVRITTNAGWKFSADGEYSKVILKTDSSVNTVHHGTSIALNPVERTIWFTPTQPPYETLKAGTQVSTVVKFQTDNHPDSLPAGSDEIVITRTAKIHCENIYYRHDELNNLLHVTAYTNTEWRVICPELKIDSTLKVDSYDAHVATFPIPGDEIFAAREYHFTTTSASAQRDTTVWKAAASLRFVSTTGFPSPSSGQRIPEYGVSEATSNYYLNFEGTYSGDFDVRVMRTVGDITKPGTIVHGSSHKRKMLIAAADSWDDCHLAFEYKEGINTELSWRQIFYPNGGSLVEFIQGGYSVKGRFDRQVLQPSHTTLRVHLEGFFPGLYAYAVYDGQVSAKKYIPAMEPDKARQGEEAIGEISIARATSWDKSRAIQVYVSDSTRHKTIHIADIDQLPLHIDTRSNVAMVDVQGQTITFPFTGHHSGLNVIVDEQYRAAVIPESTTISAGGDFTLVLDVSRNEGKPRNIKVLLKDHTDVTRSELTITQLGEEGLILQRLAYEEWPNMGGSYEPFDCSDKDPNEIAEHFRLAGIVLEAGKDYYIASARPVANPGPPGNPYWILRRVQGDTYTLGQIYNGLLPEFYVLLKRN